MVSMTQERERTRSEVADYLREFADELDPAGSQAGGDSRTGAGSGASTGRSATESGAGTPGTGTGDDSVVDEATDDDGSLTADDDRTDGRTTNQGAGDRVTIIVGNESATINPPETLSFAIDVDTDSSLLEAGADRSATFSLRWSEEHVEADDSLEVE